MLYTSIPSDVAPSSVVSFLHDHEALIGLSPLVTSHKRLATEGSEIEYTVYEQIPVLPFGLWKTTISFKTAFKDQESGVWSKVHAPLGFVSEALYEVEEVKDEHTPDIFDDKGKEIVSGWVLKETITSSCNFIFKSFVDASLVPTRRMMAKRLMAKLSERTNE